MDGVNGLLTWSATIIKNHETITKEKKDRRTTIKINVARAKQ